MKGSALLTDREGRNLQTQVVRNLNRETNCCNKRETHEYGEKQIHSLITCVCFYYQKYSNVHLRFPGPILSFFPLLFRPTKHSPSLLKASRSKPRPLFSNCIQNDITLARHCLTSFRKKSNCILLNSCNININQNRSFWYPNEQD